MIEYLTYKKEKLPILVSYRVLKHFEKVSGGKEFSDIGNDYTLMEPLLFLALQSGFKYEDKDFNYTNDDMEYILDECFKEFSALIPTFFSDEQITDGDTKKK
jgi:hypothetical protein